jgi:hypothetical protein
VQLVSEDGETYRIQSAHRLQFRQDLSDDGLRFKFVEELLTLLVADTGSDSNRPLPGSPNRAMAG